jgi:hypothetical protein
VARDVPPSQGEAGAGGECSGRDRHSDGKAAPTGADVPTVDDVNEIWLGVEVCGGPRETAAQQRGEVIVS